MLLPLLAACSGSDPADPEPTETGAPPASCEGDDGGAATFLVRPYVQAVTDTEAWILWETPTGEGSRVDFGPTPSLGATACGDIAPMFQDVPLDPSTSRVHEVRLGGLTPGSVVHYQVQTGDLRSEVLHFRTRPPVDEEAPVRLVALGDSQRDDGRLDTHREVVQDGVVRWARLTWDQDLARAIDAVVVAGDLVDNGWSATDWTEDFFPPAAELMAAVPYYPVPGNHEGNSPLFFRYFHLPEGGGEHWYSKDLSNVRLIGLDSNSGYDGDEQLDWLVAELDRTCQDPTIDFVFAQLHHPHRSELWPAGESDWTGRVVAELERFTTDCGKPSVHLFGHTHGYSRGQSEDHRHLWVNVSSAGGALDRWGSPSQVNYPQFSVSQDTWGFVAVEVEAGDDPSFRLSRVSRGNPDDPHDNAITDTVRVSRDPRPPATPSAEGPPPDACGGPAVLRASSFSDPDGGAHQASQWEVASTCEDFSAPLVRRWRQSADVFQGIDLQAGDDLTDEEVPELEPGASACWRARYRDDGLSWSEWSVPTPVQLPACR